MVGRRADVYRASLNTEPPRSLMQAGAGWFWEDTVLRARTFGRNLFEFSYIAVPTPCIRATAGFVLGMTVQEARFLP